MPSRNVVLVMLSIALFGTSTRGQSTAPATGLTGGQYRGRQISFAPRYGRVHVPPTKPRGSTRAARS